MELIKEYSDSGTIKTEGEKLLHNACNDLVYAVEAHEIKAARDKMFALITTQIEKGREELLEEVMGWAVTQGEIHAQLAEEIVGNNDWHKAKVEQAEELTNLLRSLKTTK